MTDLPHANVDENARHAEKARKHKAARDKIMATKVGEKGLLIVHTGAGKGKTSAALGMVVRHIGHGMPVAVVQFTKSGLGYRRSANAGAFPRAGHAAYHGRRFYLGDAGPRARHRRRSQRLGKAKELIRDEPRMVVLESSTSCCATTIYRSTRSRLPRDEKPADKHVVITGRNAKPN